MSEKNSEPDVESDDTDALLSADPVGSLFRNLTLKELEEKTKAFAEGSQGQIEEEDHLDHESSTYFNANGDLVLSGLEEWTDDSEIASGSEKEFLFQNGKGQEERGGGDADFKGIGKKKKVLFSQDKPVDINLEQNSSAWNIPLPPSAQAHFKHSLQQHSETEKGGQIFTRAPNFRTPGGYQPGPEKESRNLTEEEIRREVRKMYHEGEEGEEVDASVNVAEDSHCESPTQIPFAKEVPFLAENKGEKAQPSRKKHSASKGKRKPLSTAQSHPVRTGSSTPVTVSQPVPQNSHSSEVSQDEPYSTKVIRGMKRTKEKPAPYSLSPITPEGAIDGVKIMTPDAPEADSNNQYIPPEVQGPAVAYQELKRMFQQIQGLRPNNANFKLTDVNNSETDSYVEELKDDESSYSNKRHTQKTGSHRQTETDWDSDLETLLNEAEMDPEDFNKLMDDLDIENCDVGPGIEDLLSEIVNPETSPNSKEQANLSHWAQSGAVEYVEKFHEEKWRRQECEAEVARLHTVILDIRQENAVLQGQMRQKNAALLRIRDGWKTTSKEWKAFQSHAESELEKLQKANDDLVRDTTISRDRIADYEKDLAKSFEMANGFQKKVIEKEEQVQQLQQELHSLQTTVDDLKKTYTEISDEKKTAVRALTESQSQMDLQNRAYSELEKEASELRVKVGQIKEVEVINRKLEERNEELRAKIKELSQALTTAEAEQMSIARESEAKLRGEAERLHSYYQGKVSDALKAAGDKAAEAQSKLMDSMKRARMDDERKLQENRDRYQSELTRTKTKYEAELAELRRDNIQKQLLITKTAHQLQSGGAARSETVDKLQNIVHNFPSSSILEGGEGDRPDRNCDRRSNGSNIEYAKFVENLSKRHILCDPSLSVNSSEDSSKSSNINKNDLGFSPELSPVPKMGNKQ